MMATDAQFVRSQHYGSDSGPRLLFDKSLCVTSLNANGVQKEIPIYYFK